MSRYIVKIQTITESEVYVEADSVETAVYKAENEGINSYAKQPEVTTKNAIGISLVEETLTEQELPSTE
tara:strand:- start:5228 stop:5434 length:207 start_codon:yes stop_codon:yes gene_type:complete